MMNKIIGKVLAYLLIIIILLIIAPVVALLMIPHWYIESAIMVLEKTDNFLDRIQGL